MKTFLKYVEIQTKITSTITFLYTLTVMLYWKIPLNAINLMVFFGGMFVFDLTTTAINNYIDSKGNGNPTGYSNTLGLTIIFLLLGISLGFGLWLVYLTDIIVLLVGMFCFAVGIFYTYGPIPISRQPYGEIISGVMYGYVIPFIMIYICQKGFILHLNFDINSGMLDLGIQLKELFLFILVFMTPTLLTSSIMLANNTCDVEKDILVKRFTLPFYLGQKWSIRLMAMIYIIIFLSITIVGITGALPLTSLASLALIGVVRQNFIKFRRDLIKHVSFKFIIKNFIIILVTLTTLVFIGSCI